MSNQMSTTVKEQTTSRDKTIMLIGPGHAASVTLPRRYSRKLKTHTYTTSDYRETEDNFASFSLLRKYETTSQNPRSH